MPAPITLSIPHQLGRVEARARLQRGLANLTSQLPGKASAVSESWDGDRLTFRVAALGQSISGEIEVFDASVTMSIELPGVFGLIAGGVKARLQKAGQLLLTRK